MKLRLPYPTALALALGTALLLAGCEAKGKVDPRLAEPPPAQVEHELDAGMVKVDHPEQFPLVAAEERVTSPELNVTGVVSADVSRNVPVISLASGRVVEVRARLGDEVQKGQLLMRVQSADISAAFSDYRQALADETLARAQYERAKTLYDKGAVARKDLEVAEDAETKAKVTVENTQQRLKVLGADPANPNVIVDIRAPVSGIITDQQVTTASGVQSLGSTNPFTISDMSHVWVICDVYENDLATVHVGEYGDVRLNAYPDRVFRGRISNIGPILDPNLRTAKVRIEMENPGMMRFGMFVRAAFHGQQKQVRTVVPASAILHLHDRDWAYLPAGANTFRRVEVAAGRMVPPDQQEVVSGLKPGDRVVSNALVLQNTAEQ